MTFRRFIATTAAAGLLALPIVSLAESITSGPPDDSFITGYAAAVLERELSIKPDGLKVTDGHVHLWHPPLSPAEKAQVAKSLGSIPGVTNVTVHAAGDTTVPAAKPLSNLEVDRGPAAATTNGIATAGADESGRDNEALIRTDATPLTLYLGVGRTFEPLMADPRWPHFYASYHRYARDESEPDLENVASVGFGETLSLIKQSYASGFRWEAGAQAGLFAIFDLDSDSQDLINADYFVGPYFAARYKDFSLLARVYHQSSHLGDEYVLRPDAVERENTSYETFNLLLSYDLPAGFRVYGGGGYLINTDPNDLEPWTIQYGVEWVSPQTILGTNWVRPVAAFDAQQRELNDWSFGYSIRAGVQLEDPNRFTQRLQIMAEYYDGNSYNGQFYDDDIRYFGIGAHFYF